MSQIKRESLDPEGNVDQNRDFYKAQDVRPPYTYAALIRQVIHLGSFKKTYIF